MKASSLELACLLLFCVTGWVCAESGNEEDPLEPPAPAALEVPDAAELFGAAPPGPGPGGPVELSEPSADPDADLAASVEMGTFGRIDLHIEDQSIVKVLQMLAIQSQRNILTSSAVAGNVSAALYNVDFHEALDAVLHTNGYGYIEEGNFIKVYTIAEIEEIEARNRRMVVEVVRVNYLSAADAARFLEPMLTPAIGTITVSEEKMAGFDTSIASAGEKSWAHPDMLLIRDYPEVIAEMLVVLGKLDVKPPQIQIEATILEARLSEENAFGVDLTILADFGMDELTNPLSFFDDVTGGVVGPSGQGLTTTPGNTVAGASTVQVGILNNDVAAFIRALDAVTDTTVLANPKLQTLNQQSAKLISGAKLGYISTTATETSATQSVEFLEVGTQLAVRPFICEDRYVRLEVRPEISEGEVRSVEQFVIPDETTSELIANVIVPSGKWVVLGGLFKEDTTVTRRQVPLVGNIPLLGNAFKGQDDIVQRSEVIFLIRPTIVRDRTLVFGGERAAEDIEMARLGARIGLLPWSRSKLTASHLSQAHRFLGAGDKHRAMLEINMALSVDPTTVEAHRLKKELTGCRPESPDRGLIRDAIEQMIDEQLRAEAAGAAWAQPGPATPDPAPDAEAADAAPPAGAVIDAQEAAASVEH